MYCDCQCITANVEVCTMAKVGIVTTVNEETFIVTVSVSKPVQRYEM